MTIGEFIASRRKSLGLTQKDLAQLIKKEGGDSISPQYLNDIELGRRNPASDRLLDQFAQHLAGENDRDDVLDQLYFLAGQLPADVREGGYSPRAGADALKVFRKSLKQRRPK
ncbi:MAG: helix-turn-helix transcriptional regulator [Chloroflexota bacterium]|nr:helix-turn-helix transcriptional regulator [Chloroflexota bacterium]